MTCKTVIEAKKAVCTVKSLPVAACDERVMGQVFVNIIGNSLKYVSPNKTPKISISAKRLKTHTKSPMLIFVKIDPLLGLF